MSTFTENYDFIKPDNEDYYDIQDFNENMDSGKHCHSRGIPRRYQ